MLIDLLIACIFLPLVYQIYLECRNTNKIKEFYISLYIFIAYQVVNYIYHLPCENFIENVNRVPTNITYHDYTQEVQRLLQLSIKEEEGCWVNWLWALNFFIYPFIIYLWCF